MENLLVCLSKESRPVGEAAGHQPEMDVVELIVVYPQILCIINDEFEVWRHAIEEGELNQTTEPEGTHTVLAGRDSDQYL